MKKNINNATLEANFKTCVFKGKNFVGNGCKIFNSFIENCTIEDGAEIFNSVLKDCVIRKKCSVGPFAQIRSNSEIGEKCRIGNFVEIKNSVIGAETKIAHLTYVGDAEIGENCNIGAGVVFCNYNGFEKQKILVGNRVFIGSNSTLIAPLKIDDESFIAGGSVINKPLKKGEFAIARVVQEVREFDNPYLKNFRFENKYFGTDGIRGIYGEFLNEDLIQKVARSLCFEFSPKIVLGQDTRPSGKILSQAFCDEITKFGGRVYDLGVVPTACVAFQTREMGADFGVMITASHNPKEYNGIKILNKNGIKLNEKQENTLEKRFNIKNLKKQDGEYVDLSLKKNKYFPAIKNFSAQMLDDLTVVLDCANGASSKIAPQIFKSLGAKVFAYHTAGEINENCGCLFEENIKNLTLKHKADLGFAFDGDADRILAVNSKGQILNGDEILYILTWYFKKNNMLKNNKVVGTILTNLGIENKIRALGVELVRMPVGDKFIIEEMIKSGAPLGGEQSGHIIVNGVMPSGDGVLVARILAHIYLHNKNIFSTVKDNKYVQVHKDIVLKNNQQKAVLHSKEFLNLFNFYKNKIAGKGRLIIRASGTEPKIRIMVEMAEKNLALVYAIELKKKILKIPLY